MKNLVLAMHNYHDTNQAFPYGGMGTIYHSWAPRIFPFIEQQVVYDNLTWTASYNSNLNAPYLGGRRFEIFTCPSDTNRKPSYFVNSTVATGVNTAYPYYHHNYVVCIGSTPLSYPSDNTTHNRGWGWVDEYDLGGGVTIKHGKAMFCVKGNNTSWGGTPPAYNGDHLQTTMPDLTDGTSNIVCLSEVQQGWYNGTGAQDFRGIIFFTIFSVFSTMYPPNTTEPDHLAFSVTSLPNQDQLMTHLSNVPPYPGASETTRPQRAADIQYARSAHPGGINVGIADGSVRFIPDTINTDIWRRWGGTQTGEPKGTL
jgi:hypothetical protein